MKIITGLFIFIIAGKYGLCTCFALKDYIRNHSSKKTAI